MNEENEKSGLQDSHRTILASPRVEKASVVMPGILQDT